MNNKKDKIKMRRRRYVLIIVLTAILAVIIYYGAEVIAARSRTQEIVDGMYAAGQIKIGADALSERQIDILLAVEDPGFYRHHGVDFSTPGAGWTTITQGLAKRFYFADFRQGIKKIKQTLCAWLALDPLVPKQTQLELYINLMYYGNGVYGLYDAAQVYYGKAVPDLTEDEYISLIACLIDPEGLNIKDHPANNAQRSARIARLLAGEYTPQGLFDITYEGAG